MLVSCRSSGAQRLIGLRPLIAVVLVVGWMLATAQSAFAVGPEALPLWAEGAPHAQGSEESDTPTIRAYLPQD